MTVLHTAFEFLENVSDQQITNFQEEMKLRSVNINLYDDMKIHTKDDDLSIEDSDSIEEFLVPKSKEEEKKSNINRRDILQSTDSYYAEKRPSTVLISRKYVHKSATIILILCNWIKPF